MNKPTWEVWIFRISVIFLALTGLGQMPIFKRYYLADIPGLGWLADFYFLHWLHYLLAIIFLYILFSWVVRKAALIRNGRFSLGMMDWFVAVVLALIVITGMMRVIKNYPSMLLTPMEALAADIVHLAAVMLFGILSLVKVFILGKN